MAELPQVTIWNEYRHERQRPDVAAIYPNGIHMAIADYLVAAGFPVITATLDQPEHGLDQATLARTDVLVWWGHIAHEEVAEAIVDRVQQRVLEGMGLIVLHSAHVSKIFRRLMGTSCELRWRHTGEKERLWVIEPEHPIAAGIGEMIELPKTEMYGEPFDVPPPETLVFASWFQGGEVFRSGCCYRRGRGKIFYFRPGHETFPIYHHPDILRVIANAVRWAAPVEGPPRTYGQRPEPFEPIG